MSIIVQAIHRLEELARAGLVPGKERVRVEPLPVLLSVVPQPVVPVSRLGAGLGSADAAAPGPRQTPDCAKSGGNVVLNLARLERSGYLVPTRQRSVLTEQFRHIKRLLLKNARSKAAGANRLPLIMVTSALPGEGKTFCAINLAMSMAAEVDTSVLLVDADVVRPAQTQRLGIQAQKGLLDALTDADLDLSELVLKTNVPKLSIIPAGARNHRSTELLASEAMDRLLETLLARYPDCVVIFDAPPLLATNEAKVLASLVGQVVLVVEASRTPRGTIGQAFAALEACPIVMSILNKADEPAEGYGYYDR